MLFRLATALLVLNLLSPVWAESPGQDTDWAQTGAEAEDRSVPVIVFVMDQDCGYCERLRREFLAATESRTLLDARAVTRELPRGGGGKLTDFDGERIRARIFLSRYQVFASPTLLFLSPTGEPLAPALVGYNNAETYAHLVDQRLERAMSGMESNERTTRTALAGTGH